MTYGPEKWDERYSSDEYVYGKEPNLFLTQNVGSISKGTISCVADGEGRNSVWMAMQGYTVDSIDFAPNGVEKTLKLAKENGVIVNAVCADLVTYEFGYNKYEGIVSIFSHFNLSDTQKLHKKYFTALKPGGIFLMEAFAKEQLPLNTGGPKNIDLLYDIRDIKKSFPKGKFELLKKDIIYLYEGKLHDGKAMVIRAMIRKPSELGELK